MREFPLKNDSEKNSKKQRQNPVQKTWNSIKTSFPMILGILLLVSLVNSLISPDHFKKVFSGNIWIDPFIGSAIGSISGGNALLSYIIGGEFIEQGVSLIAVTAFIVAWVTVGIIQLPAESLMLGKRFAITRNIVSYIASIVVAYLTICLMKCL